jgi:predicted glycosyltransferase
MPDSIVLVAVLNWGLGHAARTVPIIEDLLSQGAKVVVASDGDALALLRHAFPDVPYEELPSYNVVYPKHGSMFLSMLWQVPKIWRAIQAEHKQLDDILSRHQITAIISDHRYGVYSSSLPSVFMAHQLNIPLRYAWLRWMGRQVHASLLRHFTSIWVPDHADVKQRLSGDISSIKGLNIRYIGPLSRLKKVNRPVVYKVLAILSGIEPQRSMLEAILIEQFKQLNEPALIVRGKPAGSVSIQQYSPQLSMVDYLDAEALSQVIAESEYIVARSGYSTLMDLAKLGRTAIWIPTPGQPEQLYLAHNLAENGAVVGFKQDKLDIVQCLAQVSKQATELSRPATNDIRLTALKELLQAKI